MTRDLGEDFMQGLECATSQWEANRNDECHSKRGIQKANKTVSPSVKHLYSIPYIFRERSQERACSQMQGP